MADVESKSIPHELPSSHWLKATGQCVLERYLSATMAGREQLVQARHSEYDRVPDQIPFGWCRLSIT